MKYSEIVKKYSSFNSYDILVNLSYIFDITPTQASFKDYSKKDCERINEVFLRLSDGEPLQYILNKAYFYSRTFYVDNRVLIPRFDTEILVEQAIKIINEKKFNSCLDLCCGSGAIGITINLETNIKTDLTDISTDALEVSSKNAKDLGANVNIYQSDLFNSINKKYDIIVSNPPYIALSDIKTLEVKVKDFEPHLALDGKEDGLYFYRRIIEEAPNYLNKNGYICFEVAELQSESVKKLLKNNFKNVRIVKDFNNINRVVIGELC